MKEKIMQRTEENNKKEDPISEVIHCLNNLGNIELLENFAQDNEAEPIVSMENSIIKDVKDRSARIKKCIPFFIGETARKIEDLTEHIATLNPKGEKETDEEYCKRFEKYIKKSKKLRKEIISEIKRGKAISVLSDSSRAIATIFLGYSHLAEEDPREYKKEEWINDIQKHIKKIENIIPFLGEEEQQLCEQFCETAKNIPDEPDKKYNEILKKKLERINKITEAPRSIKGTIL